MIELSGIPLCFSAAAEEMGLTEPELKSETIRLGIKLPNIQCEFCNSRATHVIGKHLVCPDHIRHTKLGSPSRGSSRNVPLELGM
jgi:hypothetical protein